MIRRPSRVFFAAFLLVCGLLLPAQSTVDTGGLRGRVTDEKGTPLPGAIIRAKGPQGSKAAQSDGSGNYSIGFLTPGVYEVTASIDGFNTVIQSGVEITPLHTSQQPFKLLAGNGGEMVVVNAAGMRVDTTATTSQTSINLSVAIESFARERSLTSAFDFSPGVIANSGAGTGNPSVSGASGLENQYLIGGVNITNTGYGGIGAYDAVLGASGVGVTTDFLENLDVREGGFEAEYGGALGGVISASIKSGSNDFHGAVGAYYSPRSLNGARRNLSAPGGISNSQGHNTLDASVQFGGPIIRDKLFFFVAYNPVWNTEYTRFDISESDIAKDAIVLPNANREYDYGRHRVENYAAHLTWNITAKHKLDFIAFGSPTPFSGSASGLQGAIGRRVRPSDDPGVAVLPTPRGVPDTDSVAGATGALRINDRSLSLKYFGSYAPWINIEAQISYHLNQVQQTPTAASDVIQYTDIRRTQIFNSQQGNAGAPGIPTPPIVSPAQYSFGGLGRFQGGSDDHNTDYTLKITHNLNWMGAHELKWGGELADSSFRENPIRSGPRDGNGVEIYLQRASNLDSYVRIRSGTSAQLRCRRVLPFNTTPLGPGSACDTYQYRLNRGNFSPATRDTSNKELSLFLQDKWSLNPRVTLNLGMRYTQAKLSNPTNFTMLSSRTGNPLQGTNGVPVGTTDPNCVRGADPANPNCFVAGAGKFVGSSYSFRGEWGPRVGISWDLLGNGKSKLYANYARMFERIPNDLAIRSFGNEFGLSRATFNNPDLSGQTSFVLTNGGDSTTVAPGTRLPYKDDFIVGYQFEAAPRFLLDIKGTYRRQGRLLEDTQAASVEAIENYYYNGMIGSACTNCAALGITPATGLFPGAGLARFERYVLANVGNNGPTAFNQVYPNGTGPCPQYPLEPQCDGRPTGVMTPVGFGSPESKYKAISITATKQRGEGEHVTMQATYRISRISGNYEGLFRNDNGQKDPNISSLYDFPLTHLTRSQFTSGRLNNDTPHALRINVGYEDLFIKNLSGAVTFKWNSGTLRTPYLAHPNYQNAGEIPGISPQYYTFDLNGDTYNDFYLLRDYTAVERGANGRNSDIATWDAKMAYRWNLGKSEFVFSVLVQNIFNNNAVTSYDNFVESTAGILNPLYNSPNGVHDPREIRLGAKWSF